MFTHHACAPHRHLRRGTIAESGGRAAKRKREDGEVTPFVDIVRDRLGDRAAYHVGTVLPPHIRSSIAEVCEWALVFQGRRFTVADRRRYVLDIRNSVTVPGAMSLFFDWTGVG